MERVDHGVPEPEGIERARQRPDARAVIADAAAIHVKAEEDLGWRVVDAQHDLHRRVGPLVELDVEREERAVDSVLPVPPPALAGRASLRHELLANRFCQLCGVLGRILPARIHKDVHVASAEEPTLLRFGARAALSPQR